MRLLVDTHLGLWAAEGSKKLTKAARGLIDNPEAEVFFSAASIWEVAIKQAKGVAAFDVDPQILRQGMLNRNWLELAVTGAHAAAVLDLPPLHKDPFDRLLLAQAKLEGLTLLTSDKLVARYPGAIRKV